MKKSEEPVGVGECLELEFPDWYRGEGLVKIMDSLIRVTALLRLLANRKASTRDY